jgi:hypothetical protein
MAYIAVTNTFVNGTGNIINATAVNQNFTDIISGLSNGAKDINVAAGSFASNVTITGNQSVTGNLILSGSDKTTTVAGVINGNLKPSVTNSKDIGSDLLRWNDLYCNDATMTSLAIGGEPISTNQLTVAGTAKIANDLGLGTDPNQYNAIRLTVQAGANQSAVKINSLEGYTALEIADENGKSLTISTDADYVKLNSPATDFKIHTQNGADMTVAPTGVLSLEPSGGTFITGDASASGTLTAGRLNLGPNTNYITMASSTLNIQTADKVQLTGGSVSFSVDSDGTCYFNGGAGSGLLLANNSSNAYLIGNSRNLHLQGTTINLTGIPTSDPSVAGRLFRDGSNLCISV